MSENKTKQNPIFRVTMAPGFATGQVMHPPGTEIEWVVPEGWDAKKYGKHYAEYGPSTTFECVNKEAEDLMAAHKEVVRKKNAVKPSTEASAQNELILKLIAQNAEFMAEMRRQRESAEEKAEEEAKGKKK